MLSPRKRVLIDKVEEGAMGTCSKLAHRKLGLATAGGQMSYCVENRGRDYIEKTCRICRGSLDTQTQVHFGSGLLASSLSTHRFWCRFDTDQ